MTKKLSIVALAVCASLLTGCAVKTGNDKLEDVTSESVGKNITKEKTTKTKVKEIYGEPQKVDFTANGLEKWEYHHSRSVQKGVNYVPVVNLFVKGTDDTKKTLIVLFDGNVVKTHSFSSSEGETMGGLVR